MTRCLFFQAQRSPSRSLGFTKLWPTLILSVEEEGFFELRVGGMRQVVYHCAECPRNSFPAQGLYDFRSPLSSDSTCSILCLFQNRSMFSPVVSVRVFMRSM